MSASTAGLFDPIKALSWRLHRRTPGLTQEQIAKKIGKNQSQISRDIAEVDQQVEQLKALLLDGGGDPDVVERALAAAEEQCPKPLLRA